MPKKAYSLAKDTPPNVEIEWKGIWKNVQVRKDGQLLGTFANQRELKKGQDFPLGDGTTLRVQLKSDFANTHLAVTRDGKPLPGTAGDPRQLHKGAYGVVFFIAGLNIVLGVVGLAVNSDTLRAMGLGWPSIVMGSIFAVLGWFVWKKKSLIALGIALGLFSLDAVVTVVMVIGAGGTPPVGGLIFRVFLIVWMAKGFKAMRDLKKEEQIAPSVASFD